MNFTDVLGTWKQIKAYIDTKISSSGADSLPVGTLLTTYLNKNVFSDKWHLADGSAYTLQNSLYGVDKVGLITKQTIKLTEDTFGYSGYSNIIVLKSGLYRIKISNDDTEYNKQLRYAAIYKLNLQTNNFDKISSVDLLYGSANGWYDNPSSSCKFIMNDFGIVFSIGWSSNSNYVNVYYSKDFKTFKNFLFMGSSRYCGFFFINSSTIVGGSEDNIIKYDINTNTKTSLPQTEYLDFIDGAGIYFNNKIYLLRGVFDCNSMKFLKSNIYYYCLDYNNDVLYRCYNNTSNNTWDIVSYNSSELQLDQLSFNINSTPMDNCCVLKFKDKFIAFGKIILNPSIYAYFAAKLSDDTFNIIDGTNLITYLYDPSYIKLPTISNTYIKIK